jgi:iron(III) transport system substrate-binding protein
MIRAAGAIGCVLLLLGTAPARADPAALVAAARQEGTLTWYTAHTDGETAEDVGRAFTAKYPGIEVVVIRTTAQVAYQRLVQDLKNATPQCDVFSSTDIGHDEALKAAGKLAHYESENAGALSPEFLNFDKDGFYYPTAAGLVLITYNNQKVKPEEAPQRWQDLPDPKWRGRVATGHPGFSGYGGVWVVMMRKLFGWDYFDRLERNKPRIGRSINDTVTMLNAAESLVAAGPAATTLQSADRGNPVALVYPADGAILMISPSAVLANAPHPNAARLFLEFLLGPEHARIQVRHRAESIRPDVAPLAGAKPFREVTIVRPTVEDVVRGIPEVIDQWRDTFGG